MRPFFILSAFVVATQATTLQDICTSEYAEKNLPQDGFYPGITIERTSVSAALVFNTTYSSEWYPTTTINYCNITFAYAHDGQGDTVHVSYWLPAPDSFKNRYISTGGGGLAINSGDRFAPTGVIVGGVAGLTDGGFGNFDSQWDSVFLLANGTINWPSVYMFGYQAQNELAVLGKEFTKSLYNTSDLYSYYQGCSEGGREGWSQIQRFADQFDGVTVGAPAMRFSQQQINHLHGSVVEQTVGYYPSSCEFEKILNLTLAACDPLDGLEDGIVARSDLCKLRFDLKSTIGEAYSCTGPPAQNGTITAEAIEVVETFLDGLHDTDGLRVYLGYQPGASFSDAATSYNETTGTWGVEVSALGGEWVARYLLLQDTNTLSLENVTYDTLKQWAVYGQNKYTDSVQTTWPDLSDFKASGGKVIHIHGEADDSIPAGSSVHYYESVRSVMYPNMSYNDSVANLDDFYQLYLVPGGAHCGVNARQPGGPWPQTSLQTVIEWVEQGIVPKTLNGTGNINTICRWPLRPLWSNNGSSFDCVYDQESIDTWKYDFDAYNVPLY